MLYLMLPHSMTRLSKTLWTKVFVGPTTTGITTGVAYDEDAYDASEFDETVGYNC